MRALQRIALVVTGVALAAGASACGHHKAARHAAAEPPSSRTSATVPDPPSSSAPSSVPAPTAGSAAPTVPAGPPRPAAAGAPVPARCQGGALEAQFRVLGTTGGRHTGTVGLRNRSTNPCSLSGYPGLQLLDEDRFPISTNTQPQQTPPVTVVLPPGGTAWAGMSWLDSPVGDEPKSGGCQPSATQLGVNPPDDTTQLFATFAGGPVCDYGRIALSPLADVS
jgi:Protein of unknown function (DUF4232)